MLQSTMLPGRTMVAEAARCRDKPRILLAPVMSCTDREGVARPTYSPIPTNRVYPRYCAITSIYVDEEPLLRLRVVSSKGEPP